jgi:hypothetical protein
MNGISQEYWMGRMAERADLSTYLYHLTRPASDSKEAVDALEVLLKMLTEKRLLASATGFITGGTPVVCFQDAPPQSIAQNLWFERKYRQGRPKAKLRYLGVGLALQKRFVYARGGRPVIYDKKEAAKKYVEQSEWWRIVDFDLADDDTIVDWTHEREWRMRGDLVFEYGDVHVLVNGSAAYQRLHEKCRELDGDILGQVAGVLTLPPLLW